RPCASFPDTDDRISAATPVATATPVTPTVETPIIRVAIMVGVVIPSPIRVRTITAKSDMKTGIERTVIKITVINPWIEIRQTGGAIVKSAYSVGIRHAGVVAIRVSMVASVIGIFFHFLIG